MSLLLLQVVEQPEAAGAESISLIELFTKMGPLGLVISLLLVVLSLIGLYIFIERYLNIGRASKIDGNFMNNIRDYVSNGNIPAAKNLCQNSESPVARMLEKGLMRIGKPLKNIEVAIENVGELEIFKLEKNLNTLATIAGAAPMLGFLGTVTGMINAFFQLSKAGNNIDPGQLAGGIYEAMLTTALGLAIGIMAYIGYNYLVNSVQKVIHKMEASTVEFMDLLQEPVQ